MTAHSDNDYQRWVTARRDRAAWYRGCAEGAGEAAVSLLLPCHDINDNGIEAAVNFAREAWHFAALSDGHATIWYFG